REVWGSLRDEQLVARGALGKRAPLVVAFEVDRGERVQGVGDAVGIGAGARLPGVELLAGVLALAAVVLELHLTSVELEGLVEVVDQRLLVGLLVLILRAAGRDDLRVGGLLVGALCVGGV